MLHEFLTLHREEIITRTHQKVAARDVPWATGAAMENGIPLFLDQLAQTLRREQQTAARQTSTEMADSALLHGGELRKAGFTLGQVVHGYGDVCQAVTSLAMELELPISPDEFKTLNRCLDEAIAQAVTEFARQRDIAVAGRGTERHGFFVHELRNLLGSAMSALEVLKTGTVGLGGSVGGLLERSLLALRDLIDRSVVEARIEAGRPNRSSVPLGDLMDEVGQAAALQAKARALKFTVGPVESGLAINVDRQPIAAALNNLLQNAFKFSRPGGAISLTMDTATAPGRVLMQVQDECGGLGPRGVEGLFLPFEQRSDDRSGLGLGLASARSNVEANGGQLHARSLPGQGCVFTISLPLFHGPGVSPDRLAVGPGAWSGEGPIDGD